MKVGKVLRALGYLLAGAAMGAALQYAVVRTVPCEVEDSCTIDYRDGEWHVGPNGSAYAEEGK